MKPPASVGIDFTRGNLPSLLVRFIGPMLLANLLNSLYNMVDMVIIGQYVGSFGTVAVSQGGKMLMFLNVVSMGFSGSGQILIAQQIGAGQTEKIKNSIGTLFSILFIFAVSCSIVCLALSNPIIRWLNTPPEAYAASLAYLRITSAGLPFLFAYTAVSSILRGMGDSRNPLLFIGIAAALNLVLDVLFVAVFRMGAAGAALATVIAQGISFLFAVRLLYKRRRGLHFDFKLGSFSIHRDTARIILGLGLPMSANGGLIQVTQLVLFSYVNMFGLIQAAAYGIGDKITHLLNIVQMSMQQGSGAMVGQNVGAGKQDRVKGIVWTVLWLNLAVSAAAAVFLLAFPVSVFSLFTKDQAVLEYSVPFIWVAVLCMFLSSVLSAFSGVTTGVGNARLAFLGGFLDGVVFRVLLSLLLGYTFRMGVTGFFLGNVLGRLGPILVHCPYYFSGAWKRRKRLVDEPRRDSAV